MRKQLITVFLILAATALAAFGADKSIGTWKLDVAKSKYTPAPMPVKSLTVTREASDGGVYKATGRTVISNGGKTMTTTAKGTNGQGKEFTQTFVFDKQ